MLASLLVCPISKAASLSACIEAKSHGRLQLGLLHDASSSSLNLALCLDLVVVVQLEMKDGVEERGLTMAIKTY